MPATCDGACDAEERLDPSSVFFERLDTAVQGDRLTAVTKKWVQLASPHVYPKDMSLEALLATNEVRSMVQLWFLKKYQYCRDTDGVYQEPPPPAELLRIIQRHIEASKKGKDEHERRAPTAASAYRHAQTETANERVHKLWSEFYVPCDTSPPEGAEPNAPPKNKFCHCTDKMCFVKIADYKSRVERRDPSLAREIKPSQGTVLEGWLSAVDNSRRASRCTRSCSRRAPPCAMSRSAGD